MKQPYQPENLSLAISNKFRLSFSRIPEVTYFCQTVNVPGVSMSPTQFSTPFTDLPVPGDKIMYDEFRIAFLVDEDYKTWQSLYDWITAMTFPENFDQYKNLSTLRRNATPGGFRLDESFDKAPQYSDAILTVNTNKNNPNIRFKFVDLFPISIGTIDLSEEFSPDSPILCDAIFRYSYFTLQRV
jgi:hypothetical protein